MNPLLRSRLDAVGLSDLPELRVIAECGSGTLALHGKYPEDAVLVFKGHGIWRYLLTPQSYTDAGDHHAAGLGCRPLVTGIPESAWLRILAEPDNARRIEIAHEVTAPATPAASAVAPSTPDVTDLADIVDVQGKLAELRVGLTCPTYPKSHTYAAALCDPACGPATVIEALRGCGVGSTTVRENGGGHREDLSCDLTNWHDTVTWSAGRGGKLLSLCTFAERVDRLLSATRERRMLAHLDRHRGVVQRLRTWRCHVDPLRAASVWQRCAGATGDQHAALLCDALDLQRVGCDGVAAYSYQASVLHEFGKARFDDQDTAASVGRVLDVASAGLWSLASVQGVQGPGDVATVPPPGWLADGPEVTSPPEIADSLRHRICERARRTFGCKVYEVRTRIVAANEGGPVLAPSGLRTFDVVPGLVALVEVPRVPYPRGGLARAFMSELLRPGSLFSVGTTKTWLRAVYLAEVDYGRYIGLARRRPGEAPFVRGQHDQPHRIPAVRA